MEHLGWSPSIVPHVVSLKSSLGLLLSLSNEVCIPSAKRFTYEVIEYVISLLWLSSWSYEVNWSIFCYYINYLWLQLRNIGKNHLSRSEVHLQKYLHSVRDLSPKRRKSLISGVWEMIWKALGWMVLGTSATEIKLKCYCPGLFEECLLKKPNTWAD